jgi:hypothetical protein
MVKQGVLHAGIVVFVVCDTLADGADPDCL